MLTCKFRFAILILIGCVAFGGVGAAIGAAAGAGAGTAVQLITHGKNIRIPSETPLEFTLQQPVTTSLVSDGEGSTIGTTGPTQTELRISSDPPVASQRITPKENAPASPPATFAVGSHPYGMAFDGSNIWVVNNFRNTVTKLRASDVTNMGTFAVGSSPGGAAFDGANIWVVNTQSSSVTKLRASDGTVLSTTSGVGCVPTWAVFDGENIWVSNSQCSKVTKIRASDGTVLATYAVGDHPEGLAFDGANIWVANSRSNSVTKLRASDGTVLGTFPVGTFPEQVAFDGTNIWVTNDTSGTVTKLLASNGKELGTFRVGTGSVGIAFDGVNIWVANNNRGVGNGSVTELNANGVVLGTFTVGRVPNSVAFDGAYIWVTNEFSDSVSKLRASSELQKGGIRKVDFQNFDYASSCIGEDEPTRIIHVSKGQANDQDEDFWADKPVYGDLKGDGQEEAVVVLSCHPSEMSANVVSSEIFVFEMSASGPKILAKLPSSNWGGRRVESATLSGKYVVVGYLDGECNACTDWIVSVRFQWNGAWLVRVGQTREPYKPS
jgi:hypothetical protein